MSESYPEFNSESAHGLDAGHAVWISRFTLPEGSSFGQHAHEEHQLAWAAEGHLVATVGPKRWVLSPAQALWIPSRVTHDLTASRRSRLVCAYVWPAESARAWKHPQIVRASALMRELLTYLANPELNAEAARLARDTLLHVLEPTDLPAVHLPAPQGALTTYVGEAILADPSLEHGLSDWAIRLHVSSKTLQRAFLADTGMTFSQWRVQARLHRSLPLLADGLPVAVVAARVGYTSGNGFVTAFRRHFGCTPTELSRV